MKEQAPTHKTVREIAAQILMELGGPKIVSKKWLLHFLTRYSKIYLKIDWKINILRIQNINFIDL